jgi:hypothetical protein
MRHSTAAAAVLLAIAASHPGSQGQTRATPSLIVTTAGGDHVVLEIAVTDRAPAATAAVSASSIEVDGREVQHVLFTPGSGRPTYTALLGPLDAGQHAIALKRSALWPWAPEFEIASVTPRIVGSSTGQSVLLAHTPTIGIRADTIGTASDVPLLVYVEDARNEGKGWIRYSAIMSHEDGGTAAPALMARWGRTTDIELMYEVELDGPRLVQDRFQGPDHEVRS